MKKTLNILGIISSVFLSFVISILLIVLSLSIAFKNTISEKGIEKIINTNSTDTIKSLITKDDPDSLSKNSNINKEDLISTLDSKELTKEISSFLSQIIKSTIKNEDVIITKEQMTNLINLTIDKYNKIAKEKITDEERNEITSSITSEKIKKINDEINNNELSKDIKETLKVFDFVLYGSFTIHLFIIIIVLIIIIALFRYSYYKWIPYVSITFLCTGLITLLSSLLIDYMLVENITILSDTLTNNLLIISSIYILIAAFLLLAFYFLKKYVIGKESNLFKSDKNDKCNKDI